ncbi:MAG: hypothetical protein ACQERS_07580 [Bacteroidota bacterium]
MVKKSLIIILVFLFSVVAAKAQIGKIRGLVNNYIEQGSYTEQLEVSIPMAVIEPDDNGIFNTARFATAFPDLNIQVEKFDIEYPDLSKYVDTIYVVWFLKDLAYARSGESNIIIFGVTPELDVHYYFDNNNDRIFSPGETMIDFEPYEKDRKIEMTINEKNEYLFSNPFYDPASVAERKKVNYNAWEIIGNKINPYFVGGFTFGRGDAYVSYNSSRDNINRIKYFGGIFASGRFTVGVGIDWRHLNLEAWGAFEVLDYDETWRYEYSDMGQNINYNTGVWMKNKLYAGIELGYDLQITRALSIGPAVSYSIYKVIGNKPIDPALDYDPDARYYDTNVIEYIIRMKVISTERSKIEFRVYYSDTSLDAHEFFPDFEGGYSSTYKQIYLGAKYIYRLEN